MSKPIFIVRFPYAEENRDKYLETFKQLGKQLSDYHVLCPMDNSVNRVEFECYNAINATDKDIEEIKKMVLKTIESYE
jgi:hypothetical protein